MAINFMRIIYTDILGNRCTREFSDWLEMCLWLKRFYPLLKAAEEIGQLFKD